MLNNNKDLTVHMNWDSKSMKSVTNDYKFDSSGNLTEASVTLAGKTGNADNHMNAASGYIHGSTITDSKLQKAYVVAHELAHVEQAEAPGGKEIIDQRGADELLHSRSTNSSEYSLHLKIQLSPQQISVF